MGFESLCENVLNNADRSLGCVVVDLNSGMPVASRHQYGAALNASDEAAILRSSMEVFRGKFTEQVVRTLPGGRQSANGFVKEAQISTNDTYQFMVPVPGWDDGLIVLVTERNANLGLGWMAVHRAVESFESIDSALRDVRLNPPSAGQAATLEQQATLRPPLSSADAREAHRPASPAASPTPAGGQARPRRAATSAQPLAAKGSAAPIPKAATADALSATSPAEAQSGAQQGGEQPVAGEENAKPAPLLGPRAMMFKNKKHFT